MAVQESQYKIMTSSPVYAASDIHGKYNTLVDMLIREGLIDNSLRWTGEDSVLCFLGDYVDRGPDGIGVIELIMQLENDARTGGGQVISLIGNHDIFMLAAYHFSYAFRFDWISVGGQVNDLARLTEEHVKWLQSRPAMALVNDYLLIHADALMYFEYGSTIDEVNNRFCKTLRSTDETAWYRLLDQFSERYAFFFSGYNGQHRRGVEHARSMLEQFGGRQIIHGHTPISTIRDHHLPEDISDPFMYAHGLCINVDGGMYQGSPGVLFHIKHKH